MRIMIQQGNDWLQFTDPVDVLTARTPEDVQSCLVQIDRSGLWAAGFVSYEAAGAFDEALTTHDAGDLPLLQFGLFEEAEPASLPAPVSRPSCMPRYELGGWAASVERGDYIDAISKIKDHIAAGDTYQVNYTFRLTADFSGDPAAFFCDLIAAQQGGYGAYIETDEYVICSASPELFFEQRGHEILARPMKGTRKRGLTLSDDRAAASHLKRSEKDRAENIMIVDMIRNDIGRVAEAGSVETVSTFDVEKYPTVWQMTSTVAGKIKNPAVLPTSTVWNSLFPCASITGAPKAKTMELIRSLETGPRGIYTGSIGFIAPNGDSQFNVAIRTAVVDRAAGSVEYGIGGGIVWDSDADAEYDEALSKAAILTKQMPEFELLETMLWEEGEFFLLENHLKRLAESAAYFDFQVDLEAIRGKLKSLSFDVSKRVRLLLKPGGTVDIQAFDLTAKNVSFTVAVALKPVDSADVSLYHKTTNRIVYERAKADFPEADDVLLYNERGEVTESCVANVVVELDGRKVTPPVSCGLLAGTLRNDLLERGEIEEGVVTLKDLKRADSIALINSVRKWQRCFLR